jgi:hypothetical protein
MKFLAFNLAVGLALVFLFTADKGDVHKAVDRAHSLATDMKKLAKETVGAGAVQTKALAKIAHDEKPSAASVPEVKAVTKIEMPAKAVPIAAVLPKNQTVSAPPAPPAVAPPSALSSPIKAGGAPSNLDPAVAKRRAEVLNDNPSPDPTLVLKKGDKLMSTSDRRRELLSLAEEMELLYAKSVSR